jgi:hypothetical protein
MRMFTSSSDPSQPRGFPSSTRPGNMRLANFNQDDDDEDDSSELDELEEDDNLD